MQEYKGTVFDVLETIEKSPEVFCPMWENMKALPYNMLVVTKKGVFNAANLANYLV